MESRKCVLVINPNSLETVTMAVQKAIGPLVTAAASVSDIAWECITLHDGPSGIVSQDDVDQSALLVQKYVEQVQGNMAGCIVACFSDPGVQAVRKSLSVPVMGIGEAGMLTALIHGQRVGVIAISSQSIPRHYRAWLAMQVQERVVAERALDIPVSQSGEMGATFERMIQVAQALKMQDRADVLLLGCAGMAALRTPLEDAVGIPVVEPCQAAAAMMSSYLLSRLPVA